MKFTLTTNGEAQSLTVLIDGALYPVTNEHPRFTEIRDTVINGGTVTVADLDVAEGLADSLALTERLSLSGTTLLFDGDPVRNSVVDKTLELYRLGNNYKPLVNFLEKLLTNPNQNSVEQLWTWLDAHGFTITSDGDFIAYKGVRPENGTFVSISHGPATVDGKAVNGAVPNHIGAVVELPRSKVVSDSFVGCASGLHAGTWEYASSFGQGAVLTVRINPRDVVSVPTDCEAQKLRTCRYKVEDIALVKYEAPVWDYDEEPDPCYCDEDPDWCDC